MSTPEDKKNDFEELKLTDEFSDSLEPIEEPLFAHPAPEQAESAAIAEEAQTEEVEKAQKKAEQEKESKKEKRKRAEAALGQGEPSQARLKAAALMQKLSTADSFTVLLSLALLALLIAIFYCLVELGRYRFDIHAKDAKQAVSAATTVEPLPHLISRA